MKDDNIDKEIYSQFYSISESKITLSKQCKITIL